MALYGNGAGTLGSAGSERAARHTIWFFAVAMAVATVAVAVRVSLPFVFEHPSPGVKAQAGRPNTTARLPAVEDLGPTAGVDVGAYVEKRRAAIAGATGERVAVVSLSTYVPEAQIRALAGELTVVALLAAAPGTGPSVVAGSMTTWASAQTAKALEEREEIRKIIPTVTDPAFKAFYASELDRLAGAVGYLTPASPLVFAVVVRGPVAQLLRVAGRAEVRLVDVSEASEPGAKATYRGLRPEEQTRTNSPSTRPG